MKLATYNDGSRDGQLVVVSRDLSTAHYATGIATRLQQVLDDWNFLAPLLQDLYDTLNHGKARHAFAFEPRQCLAPLPRAFLYLEGLAYPHLAELLGEAMSPPLRLRAGDALLGACAPVANPIPGTGLDFGAQLAVVTGEVPRHATPEQALDGIRLLMLANAWALRPEGQAVQALASAFSPVAVTLDELATPGDNAWRQGRVHLALQTSWNGRKVGLCEAATDMARHFGELIAEQARTRALRAGAVVASGTVSNRAVQVRGRQEWPRGYGCVAEKRATETLQDGRPGTDFVQPGDTVRIEMKGLDGLSLCGAIDQVVAAGG